MSDNRAAIDQLQSELTSLLARVSALRERIQTLIADDYNQAADNVSDFERRQMERRAAQRRSRW